ncbi:MAG: penicillin-binding protein activator [Burkholderiales bacterium]|nr:penicillin-binding protein activator [Burkholderiales bacterium]
MPTSIAGSNAVLRSARVVAIVTAALLGACLVASCASVQPGGRASSPAPGTIISVPAPAAVAKAPAAAAQASPQATTTPLVETPAPAGATEGSVTAKPATTPSELAAASPPALATSPQGVATSIALVLPLDVAAYARAADAVREGFLAAAASAGALPTTRVFPYAEDGVLTAFEAARTSGARVIVGPLTRDDLKLVATMALELPTTIALNQLDEGTAMPQKLYSLSLSIESDAKLIARRIRAEPPPGAASDTRLKVVIVGGQTPLLRRFASAFAQDWTALGGAVPDLYRFDGTPDAMAAMRREIGKTAPDAALLALDGGSAALAKPYLGTVPAYASGLVFEPESQAVVRDLDGLMLVEIPWIVDPNALQFATLPRREFGSSALTRLYALGLDAFRVAQAFREVAPEHFKLEGASGTITLVDGRHFVREGTIVVFREGRLTPLDVPR